MEWGTGVCNPCYNQQRSSSLEQEVPSGFACELCASRLSSHEKAWHTGICDSCYNRARRRSPVAQRLASCTSCSATLSRHEVEWGTFLCDPCYNSTRGPRISEFEAASQELPAPRCKVDRCRFPMTHTTRSHVCGECGRTGHGQRECGDQAQITSLRRYLTERMPAGLRCTARGCRLADFHATDAHRCDSCGMYGGNHDVACQHREGSHLASSSAPLATPNPNVSAAAASRPANRPANVRDVTCPVCRIVSKSDRWIRTFIQAECCVCLTVNMLHAAEACGHGVCRDCLSSL
eukprot:TRINITY_DN25928_c0_g1_i1.p1 TRINITY_DN25928_c0_g1~~TRINITY_DN25928_c0_g1_i1.p1  ORF type:complete len:333 (-),score=34.63 TRINITY_DN25928_c0_g1_i1:71-946(-)